MLLQDKFYCKKKLSTCHIKKKKSEYFYAKKKIIYALLFFFFFLQFINLLRARVKL